MKKLLREPLVHFLLIGAGLFLLSRVVGSQGGDSSGRITITPAHVERLLATWSRLRMRPPTVEELKGLVEAEIKEEVYYREAMAMGLDRDDTIIRRRLQQKLEFLAEDVVAGARPTDAELQAFLDQHAEKFRNEARVAFRHVYLSRDRRGDAADRDAKSLLARLDAPGGRRSSAAEATGDPLPLPADLELERQSEVAKLFGADFAARLIELPVGRWAGPVESGYGLHLVLVRERTEGRPATLAEARDAVEREWLAARRQQFNDEFYRRLREKYIVTVALPDWARGAAPETDRRAGGR